MLDKDEVKAVIKVWCNDLSQMLELEVGDVSRVPEASRPFPIGFIVSSFVNCYCSGLCSTQNRQHTTSPIQKTFSVSTLVDEWLSA